MDGMLVHQRATFQVTGTWQVLSQGMEYLGGVSLPSQIATFTALEYGTPFIGIKQKLYNFLIQTEETYIKISTAELFLCVIILVPLFGMGPPGIVAFI